MQKYFSSPFYARSFLQFLRSTTFVKKVNAYIEVYGIQEGLRKTLQDINSRVKVKWENPVTEKVLATEPCIIVASHPHKSEVVALISILPKRKDFYLIMNADSIFLRVFPSISRYAIPVYINHHALRIYGRVGLYFNKALRRNKIPFNDSHKKNIESIKRAQKEVEKGSLVVMYPDGGSKSGRWFDGIGYLLSSVKSSKKTRVVMVNVQNVSPYDPFRVIPGVSKFMKTVTVIVSEPIPLGKVSESKDPKIIKSKLEQSYKEWVRSH